MPTYKAVHSIRPLKDEQETTETRLIEAPNMAAAMRYAAKDWITLELCTMSDAHKLGAAGVKLETASKED